MDNFIYSLNSTVPIFLVMVVGWYLRQREILNDNFVTIGNKLIFNVTLPLMVFEDLAAADISGNLNWRFIAYCLLVTLVCILIIWGLTELLMKDESMKGSFIQGAYRSSVAVLGLAFIENMYGDAGQAPLVLVSAVPLYNIFAVIILTFKGMPAEDGKEIDKKQNIKKACIGILKNPILIGIWAGLLVSCLHIDFPVIVDKTIGSIASMSSPLALVVIGAGFEGRKALAKIKPTVIATLIKLVIQPVLFLPVAAWMGFKNQEMIAILIMLGSPATVSGYIMAKNMNNDGVLASSIIVLTTLLSSVTLTGFIYILRCAGLV